VKKFLLALMLVALMASLACAASPLDTLKTTWEQSIERMTQVQRENPSSSGTVWTRMQRKEFANSASATALPNGYDPNGEILPFMKIVANNSGGRIRYETMGYSYRGRPIPLAIVGYPKAPKNPEEVGNRIVIRWQCSIHGGENDGAEAALIFLREVAQGKWDSILGDVVLLVTPAANPDGKDYQTRELVNPYTGTGPGGTGTGADPNRVWSKAHAVEVQAALKLYRKWDPHVIIDHHNIGVSGTLYQRHIVTYTMGHWGNNDIRIEYENTSFAEGLFGDGIGKYRNDNSHYKKFLREFIDDYSPGNTKGNPVYSLSHSFASSDNNSFSPSRNNTLSLVSMPYMEPGFLATGEVTRGGETNWEVISMLNPGSDSVRSSAAMPPSKNRFSILMEIVTSHHTWLKVWAMHASVVSTIDLCNQRKNDIFNFFDTINADFVGLNNNSPENLTTVYQGNIDYRNTGNSAGGNENYNTTFANSQFRKVKVLDGYDHGWGPEIFKYDGYHMTNASTVQRWVDHTHYPRIVNQNLAQYPIKMGAFYIMDPRATEAATILMRQGIEIYRLKNDVTLPSGTAYKVYGTDYNANWGITKNRSEYINVFTTKLPRPRAEVIDNYSTAANLVSPNYGSTGFLEGVPWVPLTTAQTPTEEDAPVMGGGDWMPARPEHHVLKAGHYVIPTAQKWGKYAGFQMEPRSNCGLLFWAHWDSAVGGNSRGNDYTIVDKFDLDLVKTFDYTAIPASALERIIFTEDRNDKPEYPFAPPFLDLDGDFSSLTDAGATVSGANQDSKTGKVTVTINDACLYDEQWLTFFFYEEATGTYIDVIGQVFEGATPGTYEVVFEYSELTDAGLKPGKKYFIHYSNDGGDIFGYGTLTKGALSFKESKKTLSEIIDDIGCDAVSYSYLALVLIGVLPFIRRKGK